MIKILLASHGNLAAGMLASAELVVGKTDNVEVLCAYVDGETDVTPRVRSFINGMLADEEWLVFTDLFGGSVNNEFMNYISKSNMRLVAGMNLPIVITAITAANISEGIDEVISELKEMVSDTVHFCSDINLIEAAREDEDF